MHGGRVIASLAHELIVAAPLRRDPGGPRRTAPPRPVPGADRLPLGNPGGIGIMADDAMAAFMQRVGRRKLIMPIYEALVKTPEGLAFAQGVFERARAGYHPITSASVEATLAKARQTDKPNP